ncbi:DUF3048 domain-containing protein [Allosaccharopolyspora coralli]|uniref:DUF3048 domain-containing protein n=1 Tax=Allosaccharopolyspora coralli TaxID=2665642 RepID=A0A5Q3QA79_9PSEU|nr:DUF3048 domain-containing protein [Allosaccharopolyspora coralli]QGK70094.1 DUF3048 domain-containing protein [Allosaccharopolyspora coralli]
MEPGRTRRLATAVVALFALSACTASAPPQPAPPPSPEGVLAIKVDNTVPGRPPVGVEAADVVYIEPVEGGLSRMLALYESRLPPRVGPVRSARETDLELLPQFGRPTLAYSGAAPELVEAITQAPIEPVTDKIAPEGFTRDDARKIPYNLFVRPEALPRGAPWPEQARFPRGPAPEDGTPAPSQETSYEAARITFDWSEPDGRWVLSMDGRPVNSAAGTPLGGPTVVFQEVPITMSGISDTAGTVSPVAASTGEGAATMFRDGKAYEGRWSRPSPQDPTRFTGPDGQPLPFADGQVWIVLVGA